MIDHPELSRRNDEEKVFRIRGIPKCYDAETLDIALREALGLTQHKLYIRSLATDVDLGTQQTSLTATAYFEALTVEAPSTISLFERSGNRFRTKIPQSPGSPVPADLTIDADFQGFTPLSPCENDDNHKIICIALHGWGGHAFGSFYSRADRYMWLRDVLPINFRSIQVWTYGYGSTIDTDTRGDLDEYASAFESWLEDLFDFQTKDHPRSIIFVAHSLGGLVLKQALINLRNKNTMDIIGATQSIFFFGVPTQGMKTAALEAMIGSKPQRYNLAILDDTVGHSSRQRHHNEFCQTFSSPESSIYQFYETQPTPTVSKDPHTGKWNKDGKMEVLVSRDSALSGRHWETGREFVFPLPMNHRDMVKFAQSDKEALFPVLKCFRAMTKAKFPTLREGIEELSLDSNAQRRPSPVALMSTAMDDSVEFPPPTSTHRVLSPDISQEQSTGRLSPQSQLVNSSSFETIEGSHHERQSCINTFHFADLDKRQQSISSAARNTCLWLFETPQFQSWWRMNDRANDHGLLWIKGKPGAGKSTIMKSALKNASDAISKTATNDLIISHFFNARGSDLDKTAIGLFRNLIFNVLERRNDLCNVILPQYRRKMRARDSSINWHIEELKDILRMLLMSDDIGNVVIYIDALDECNEVQARNIVFFFAELGEVALDKDIPLRICVSSRHYPHISTPYCAEIVVEDHAEHTQDIKTYIDIKLASKSPDEVLEDMKLRISERASGVFLWVVLIIGHLKPLYDKGQTREMVTLFELLPRDLDDYFAETLTRDDSIREETILLFQWLLFSRKPLTERELYCAVKAGNPESLVISENSRATVSRFLLDCSKGLAEITKFGQAQFIHETVRTFFLLNNGFERLQLRVGGSTIQGVSQERLRSCCYSYLSTARNEPLVRNLQAQSPGLSRQYPFLSYAVFQLLCHAEAAQEAKVDQSNFLISFSRDRDQFGSWIKLYNALCSEHNRISALESKIPFLLVKHRFHHLLFAIHLPDYVNHKLEYVALFKAAISKTPLNILRELFRRMRSLLKPDNSLGQSCLNHAISAKNIPAINMIIDVEGAGVKSDGYAAQCILLARATSDDDRVLLEALLQRPDLQLTVGGSQGEEIEKYLVLENALKSPKVSATVLLMLLNTGRYDRDSEDPEDEFYSFKTVIDHLRFGYLAEEKTAGCVLCLRLLHSILEIIARHAHTDLATRVFQFGKDLPQLLKCKMLCEAVKYRHGAFAIWLLDYGCQAYEEDLNDCLQQAIDLDEPQLLLRLMTRTDNRKIFFEGHDVSLEDYCAIRDSPNCFSYLKWLA